MAVGAMSPGPEPWSPGTLEPWASMFRASWRPLLVPELVHGWLFAPRALAADPAFSSCSTSHLRLRLHPHAHARPTPATTGTVAAITDQRGFLPPSLDPDYLYDHSATISPSTISDLNDDRGIRRTPEKRPNDDPLPSPRPAKRPSKAFQESHYASAAAAAHRQHAAMAGGNEDTPVREPSDTPEKSGEGPKPKRVRTGCLTCRQRHLKCDEKKPDCWNCIKSSRKCEKGLRLNWTDMKVAQPPTMAGGDSSNWPIAFQDESREIASEYKGGMEKYPLPTQDSGVAPNPYYANAANSMPPPPANSHAPLPPIQGVLPDSYPQEPHPYHAAMEQAPVHRPVHSRSGSEYSASHIASDGQAYAMEQPANSNAPLHMYLRTQEEVLFMQVFVEEVGLWMDSMDSMKHFSRLLPFHALEQPMLLNAFLACGARHLALVNPKYSEEKALGYYDTATRHLLEALQDPSRDTVLCATTAVILNVYEIMCEKALQRMNHIAGARALIKECNWNARSTGIGSACFWLNVGMELLSCLHFNWQVAWDPDEWGLDMKMVPETEFGREEIWTHRIVYIVAKVCNFRASIPRTQEAAAQSLQSRHDQWQHLKNLADVWNERIPRTMHPMAYLSPGTTISGSAFPEVWLIKRTSITARLFYHTCLCLLAQINPLHGPDDLEMQNLLHTHSQMICGISAHVKDRGVASVALRSLAIAAECLTERREQEEVLSIFDKIRQETGWRVGFVNAELKQKWGWDAQPQQQDQNPAAHVVNGNNAYQPQAQQPQVTFQPAMPPVSVPAAAPVPTRPRPPMGVPNPLLATADFTLPQHPYQSYYVAPNPMHQTAHQPPPSGAYY
ncbi:hypothetical protein BS50DRAFT_639154 [Corynespora cassiicola Philippines]|uniref:Zn(2)-C6 fungal-type domain-containing protein n=1 Tax=Corynespora cassiicola Philippines TaxID=1448308 RepID=A0A2T2N900_CORCC|nr:hypothetical protein BS50DRAFT_639154 [Corynespora cassiicola Philippines]